MKNMKKWIALGLALSMTTATLAACGQTEKEPSKEESKKESSVEKEESKVEEEEVEEDGIKWSGTISISSALSAPSEDGNIIEQLMEEKLLGYGYDVDVEVKYVEPAQYQEILNMQLIAGDAPDIFYTPSQSDLLNWTERGLVATWDEAFFRENAPDMAAFVDNGGYNGANLAAAPAYWTYAKTGSSDQQMTCLPDFEYVSGAYMAVAYNKQWLDNLGAEVPTTVDEFVDLMYRFTFDDPDGNGKDDTYGMSNSMFDPIFGAYGGATGFMNTGGSGYWYEVDGKLVHADVLPHNKEVLTLLNQMYEDGVIDPEFITYENGGMSYWAFSGPFLNGRIGVTNQSAFNHWAPKTETSEGGSVYKEFQAINGEDADVVIGAYPVGPYGDSGGWTYLGYNISAATCYNAALNEDPEKLAAIFQIANLFTIDDELAKLMCFGREGVDFEIAEDGKTITYLGDAQNVEYRRSIGVGWLNGLDATSSAPFNETIVVHNYSHPVYVYELEQVALGKGASYKNQLYGSLQTSQEYYGEMASIKNETWVGFITGEISLDEYDQWVEEWYSSGGQAMTDEANEVYNNQK